MGKSIDTISTETMNALIRYHWPGNIRELQNVVERAVILSRGPLLEVPTEELLKRVEVEARGNQEPTDLRATLEDAERESILAALKKTNWKVAGPKGAAALFGYAPIHDAMAHAETWHPRLALGVVRQPANAR